MSKRIRICRISPVADSEKNWGNVHEELFKEIIHDGIEIVNIKLPEVKLTSINDNYDVGIVAPHHVTAALRAEKDGFDAVIINCLLEPGLSAVREALRIPAVGDLGAALHLASLIARKFSMLLPGPEYRGESRAIADLVRQYGFENHIASYRQVGTPTLGFAKDGNVDIPEIMLKAARDAVNENGAQAIIGYGGMPVYRKLRAELPVPVISPVQASVIVAETLARANLSQSKVAFPYPKNLDRSTI